MEKSNGSALIRSRLTARISGLPLTRLSTGIREARNATLRRAFRTSFN